MSDKKIETWINGGPGLGLISAKKVAELIGSASHATGLPQLLGVANRGDPETGKMSVTIRHDDVLNTTSFIEYDSAEHYHAELLLAYKRIAEQRLGIGQKAPDAPEKPESVEVDARVENIGRWVGDAGQTLVGLNLLNIELPVRSLGRIDAEQLAGKIREAYREWSLDVGRALRRAADRLRDHRAGGIDVIDAGTVRIWGGPPGSCPVGPAEAQRETIVHLHHWGASWPVTAADIDNAATWVMYELDAAYTVRLVDVSVYPREVVGSLVTQNRLERGDKLLDRDGRCVEVVNPAFVEDGFSHSAYVVPLPIDETLTPEIRAKMLKAV